MDQNLYSKLSSMDLGGQNDDYFRSLGFSSGRQGAIDWMDKARNLYDPQKIAENQTNQMLSAAQKIRDFNIQSNQPAIQSLTTEKSTLSDRYKTLLESIKGQQGVAENAQIKATSNEMGRRGINNQSGLYEQSQADALRPIAAQFQNLSAQTGLAHEKDQAEIARAIASMQAGNPEFAIQSGQNTANAAQGAYQFITSLGAQQAQQKADNEYRNAALAAQSKPQSQYEVLGEGQTLYDLLSGRAMYTAPKTYKSSGGGGGGNLPSLDSLF